MRVRPLASSDRRALEAAVSASFRGDEIIVALELLDDSLSGMDDYSVLVADRVDGAPDGIGGYICFGPTPMTDSTFDLYWIVTHPDARGRGVASALIVAMEHDLRGRGAAAIRVETSESESYGAARRLYDRHDYPQAAFLPSFYRRGDGLLLYYKLL